MLRTAIAVFVTLAAGTAWAEKPDCTHLQGVWTNVRGTAITITKFDMTTGIFSGTIVTKSGTYNGTVVAYANSAAAPRLAPDAKPNPDAETAPTVGFLARWNIGSITAWSGVCREHDSKLELHTLWYLAEPNAEAEYMHMLAGEDVFTWTREAPKTK